MASYSAINPNQHQQQPYSQPGYNESSGFITPMPANGRKKGASKWLKFGLPILLIIVIVGAVLGGVLGSRASKKNSQESDEATASGAASVKNEVGVYPTSTNSEFMVPIYPSTTNTAAYGDPTFNPSASNNLAWPSDPYQFSNPSPSTVRTERPRVIAPPYKWEALKNLIPNDPYLKSWNDTIFGNATTWQPMPPVVYFMDGPSGILDNAREIKARIKAFSYVYRMTGDKQWVDRVWLEVQNAAGNGTQSFGPDQDRWNSNHFLDVAEFSAAYAIAYDWCYDAWSDEQKEQIRFTLNTYGLGPGVAAYNDPNTFTGWWKTNTTGNWNCVCNDGLTMASLAILDDDNAGYASTLLGLTIDNAKENCAMAVSTDGTWAETPNYWYFGTTGHAEMAATLLSATGSHYGLLDVNPDFSKTGEFHMHVSGPTSLFDWGDHGPNKFSSTANSMLFYAMQYSKPAYALFQRDQRDAADPWSMFWYDPTVSGAYWSDLELDKNFDNDLDQWVAMRSSWSDFNALYVAMKAGKNQGHQTHNDLDAGDFVLDAMGTRWAGEYGSADYRSPDYFSNDTQQSARWEYYRKMTEGQNTILVNKQNQLVTAAPSVQKYESSGTKQSSGTTVFQPDDDSTAYWIADITSAYSDVTSVKRGVRMINGRRQVLIQDEIDASQGVQWRLQTNATVEANGNKATLKRDGKTMEVQILSPGDGATFSTSPAQRFESDPTPPEADQENPGITVLIIDLPAGQYNLQVLFNPQWDGFSAFKTPASVDLANWSLTSHN